MCTTGCRTRASSPALQLPSVSTRAVVSAGSAHQMHEAGAVCVPAITIQTYRQLRAGGLSRSEIRRCVDAGSLLHLRRGVYSSPDACACVVAAAERGGAIACVTAARHLGLWVLGEDDLHVWLNDDGHLRPLQDVDVACTPHWDTGRPTAFTPPPVPRTLKQILACRGVEEFFVALESARRLGLIHPDGLRWLCAATNSIGREAVRLSRDDADSGLESLLRWRLRSHNLPVRTQVRIAGVGVVDILIGDRLIVEADGRENHEGASLRHKDLVRDASAAAWGYTTLRFDYALIVHDWDLVEAAILAAVREGRHMSRR